MDNLLQRRPNCVSWLGILCFLSLLLLTFLATSDNTGIALSSPSPVLVPDRRDGPKAEKGAYAKWEFRKKTNCSKSVFKQRLPKAILIGERKTGTGKIIGFLDLVNPKIRKPPGGEPHFFYRTKLDFDYYKKLMAPSCPGDITMEKTPKYFRTVGVAERIYEWNSDVAILLSLRDPVDRAISDFYFVIRQMVRHETYTYHFINSTFEEAAFEANGKINSSLVELQRSYYDVNLARWLKYFPLTQIHIIDADDFIRKNPAIELAKIERFLGIESKAKEEMFYKSSVGYYCPVGTTFKEGGEKGHAHPPISERSRLALQKFFVPHVIKLYKLIGRNLSWMDPYLEMADNVDT